MGENNKDICNTEQENLNGNNEKILPESPEKTTDADKSGIIENTASEVSNNMSEVRSENSGQASASLPVRGLFGAVSDFLKKCGIPEMLLMRFLGAYLLFSGIDMKLMMRHGYSPVDKWQIYIKALSFGKLAVQVGLAFIMLSLLYMLLPKKLKIFDQITLFSGIMIFSLTVTWRNNDFYLGMSITAVAVVLMNYLARKTNTKRLEKLSGWLSGTFIFTAAAAVTVFVTITTIARHDVYNSTAYDFGIFVQMFHSMATDLTAVTTCERDVFLSHFFVHASYIYYLLAPIYALFPDESTLLTAQAILAMGGIIPLFLIARKHNYKGFLLIAAGMIYVFSSGEINPCFYDFHENCFLPTLLMWLLYAVDQRKYLLFYIMSLLVCIVKEDAPLYVICIAMFLFFDEKKKERFHGIVAASISLSYFVLIMDWLVKNGDGSMMTATRFGNLTIDPDDGFVGIVKNVISDPAYFFSTFVKEETHIFFLQVMIPLLFLPFMTGKIHRFWLMIPFVIMNLVVGAGYTHAAEIRFQYIFGPACLLVYLALINCDDFAPEKRKMFIVSAAAASVITFSSIVSWHIVYYENYTLNKEHYRSIEECLESIPDDASVLSDTFHLPHIANRSEIYMLNGNDLQENPYDENKKHIITLDRYDFIVFSPQDEIAEDVIKDLEENGFTIYNEYEQDLVIYVSPEYVFSD